MRLATLRSATAGVLMLAATSAPALAQESDGALALGATAPMTDVKMLSVDGRELSIGEVRGKNGTLVVFSCNACPFAQAWEERIVALGNQYAKRGVGVIMINSNDPTVAATDDYDTMKQRAKTRAMAFPYVVDATSDVARAFGATRTPEAFLFDRDGKLVYHGAIDDNSREPKKVKTRYLQTALASVTAGKSVAMAESKAIGCSIKFRKKA